MAKLSLGLQLGYWGALYPAAHLDLAKEAEALGYDLDGLIHVDQS